MTAPFGRRKVCVALVMLLLLPGSALADKFLVVDALGKQVLSFTPETGLKPFVLPGVLISPRGAAVGPDGNLVVADFATNKVQKFNGRTGKFMKTFAVNAALTGPTGLAFGPGGDLFVATTVTDQVLRFNGTNGTSKGMFTTGGSVTGAMSLVFAPDGTLFVSGEDSNSVEQFDQTGAFMREFVAPGDGGLQRPVALRFDPNGDLEVLGADSMSLGTYDGATGEFLGAVSTMSSSGGFSRGLDGSLFVADAAGVWFMEPGQDQQYPAASAIDPAAMLRLDPDLVVKLFEAPTTQSWDYSMSIKTTVGNVGPVSAPASVVSLYFSRTNSLQGAVGFGCSRTVPVLPPGGASTTSFNCVIPPAWVINLSGPIYILAVADAPGAVVEAFEFNNVKARPFKLGPDLQVTALALTVPGPIVRGTNFTARSTVKNNGGYTATFDEGGALNQIAVELFLSKNATLDATDPSVCWVIMPNMVPLATTDVLSTCGMGAAPGSYYLIVKVDVWDQVHEFNENNNTRALRIDVVDPPPL